MIATIKIVLIILLYLMIGYRIFLAGENGLGGKEAYIELISKKTNGNPYIAYTLAMIFTTVVWPWFVIVAIVRRE